MAAVEFSVPEPGVGLITLNRPDRMNAITWDWVEDFHAILDKLADDRSVRAVVLTGAGRGFCSGFDLKADHDFMQDDGPGAVAAKLDAMERLTAIPEKMLRARQPIIAAVNGAAMGAGFAIVLAADIRVASDAVSFSVANARIGLSAGECGISWLFPRLVGLSRCFELLVTGRVFDAEEADRIGLLSRRTGPESLMDTAMDIARSIAANSGFAVRMSKDVIYAAISAPDFRTASILENRTQMLCGTTGDVKEAMSAFRQKRPPRFSA
ncbi:enoyl-CoA hydratase/isomerase family protein [Sphingobium sp.]|uniref:enoyl-CoA hydratase/isomerase family protein n=1 Tax=Sphingobium sp. TaxID=1912891 RepID=UPI002BADA1F2|nr:enoyl-CoA hydratase-related protein [Sphingobium sp.]HUD92700.1 enoyl-CoA hydratase-related protein [Sphingobium sp.]